MNFAGGLTLYCLLGIGMSGCTAHKNDALSHLNPYDANFLSQHMSNDDAPSKLDYEVYRLATKNLNSLASVEKEFQSSFEQEGSLSPSYHFDGDSETFFTTLVNPESLFNWVRYEQGKNHYAIHLGVKQTTCYDSGNLSILFLLHHKESVYMGKSYAANETQSNEPNMDIKRFELSENNYFDYRSKNISRSDGSIKDCIQEVLIYY